MRFSIVVPVYNIVDYITRCILSLKKQSYIDFEAIVIDDGSTDDSFDVACKAIDGDDRFILQQQKNVGQGG